MTLPINPEDLSRVEPSRVSVVNTLDGAWVDSFGRGLATLTISGHTGWGQNNRPDGIQQFVLLRDSFIQNWHDLRAACIAAGTDPDKVRLFFIDPHDGDFVGEVVPTQFTLRRSKSQPLLLLYNIAMVVINDQATVSASDIADSKDPVNDPVKSATSLNNSTSSIARLIPSTATAFNALGALGSSVKSLLTGTILPSITIAKSIISTANAAKVAISSHSVSPLRLASDLSGAATNIFGAAISVAKTSGLPTSQLAGLMQIKGELSNVHCVLANTLSMFSTATVDYSDLYGSSNCSSTLGGRPASATTLAGVNPFDVGALTPLASVSPIAAGAISSLRLMDVTLPIVPAQVQSAASQIQSGVTFAN